MQFGGASVGDNRTKEIWDRAVTVNFRGCTTQYTCEDISGPHGSLFSNLVELCTSTITGTFGGAEAPFRDENSRACGSFNVSFMPPQSGLSESAIKTSIAELHDLVGTESDTPSHMW